MNFTSFKYFLYIGVLVAMVKAAAVRRLRTDLLRSPRQEPAVTVHRPYYISYACERTLMKITCRSNTIVIIHATYGRHNLRHCDQAPDSHLWSTQCSASPHRTTRTVASFCNGKKTCELPVANAIFGDPCPTTYKYLEIYYACLDV